jgi:hypothetical protein
MPMPKIPAPEWTEEDVAAVRRRGKQIALEFFQENPREGMEFTVEEAAKMMEDEGLFKDRSLKWKAAMTYELHDATIKFHEELSSL